MPVLVQTINGITYPRDVPVPEGLPEGWRAVEQAYGPTSKTAGQTYLRYHSQDGTHRNILGPKQVLILHCEGLGIPWEGEYAKYEAILKEKKEIKGAVLAKEREARGHAEGAKREEMVARSREELGELTGPLVLAFAGWKCRWDWLPESQQTPNTFFAPDGREWKLLKDLECMFGTRLSQGGEEAERIKEMVRAAKTNHAAQQMFQEGSRRCRETGGSVEIDPSTEGIQVQTLEQMVQEREARVKKRKLESSRGKGQVLSLHDVSSKVFPVQSGWADFSSAEDLREGFAKFQPLLRSRGFAEGLEFIAVHGVGETSRFAARISGIYYRIGAPVNGRPCYQKLLSSPDVNVEGICCDQIYIMYSSEESRWQICTIPLDSVPCIAHCKGDQARLSDVSGPWQVQQQGTGDFAESVLQIIAMQA